MSFLPTSLLEQHPFALSQTQKEETILPVLKNLTAHHKENCAAYHKIIDVAFPDHETAASLADLPYLPVSLFKERSLGSVQTSDVRVTIKSSGTTGARKSQILMDRETTRFSTQTLSATLRALIGPKRLPLLIIDTPSALNRSMDMGARSAAILGMMPFGTDTTFALRDDLSLDKAALDRFLAKNGQSGFLVYGFTFLVWETLLPACLKDGLDLSNAILLHSGGWKHLAQHAVDNAAFRAAFAKGANLSRIINFYGMAELPGVIMAENENGLLYPPVFGDVLIRDPLTLEPLPKGKTGLVQVFSCVPHSFPGHALLTEDLGIIHSIDNGAQGWSGKGLQIIGRVPKAELRGCSDVIAETAA